MTANALFIKMQLHFYNKVTLPELMAVKILSIIFKVATFGFITHVNI